MSLHNNIDYRVRIEKKGTDYTVTVCDHSGHAIKDQQTIQIPSSFIEFRLDNYYPIDHIKKVGGALFNALSFPQYFEPKGHFGRVLNQDTGLLRLHFTIDPPELAPLVWEALYHPTEHYFLVRRRNIALIRTIPSADSPPFSSIKDKLRVLHVTSNPDGIPPLDLERALASLATLESERLEISHLHDPTALELFKALAPSETPYHILHYDGHARFDAERGVGTLLLLDDLGGPYPLHASELADYLSGSAIRLVVLAACQTGQSHYTPSYSGFAQEIIRSSGHIRAVVAMQSSVMDQAASAFNSALYERLSTHSPLEVAVAEGRWAMDGPEEYPAWLTPILVMKGYKDTLFYDATLQKPFQVPSLLGKKFVGRDAIQEELSQHLLSDDHPFTLLYGMGGVGKTTLAAHLADHLKDSFHDGVVMVEVTNAQNQGEDLMALWDTIASYFKLDKAITEHVYPKLRQQAVWERLKNKRALLIIDNLTNPSLLEVPLIENGRLKILIISHLRSVDFDFDPPSFKIPPFEEAEGMQLLEQMLELKSVQQEQTFGIESVQREREQAAAKQLIQLVGGLPLALQISSHILRRGVHDSLEEYVADLKNEAQRLDMLAFDSPTIPGIRATLQVSYRLLATTTAQKLFLLLSLFKGTSVSLEAIQALTAKPPELVKVELGTLLSYSLLEMVFIKIKTKEEGPGNQLKRYRLHSLVQDFAYELYEQSPAPLLDEMALQRVITHYIEVEQSPPLPPEIAAAERENMIGLLSRLPSDQAALLAQGALALTSMYLQQMSFVNACRLWGKPTSELLHKALDGVQHLEPGQAAALYLRCAATPLQDRPPSERMVHLDKAIQLLNQVPPGEAQALEWAYLYHLRMEISRQEADRPAIKWADEGLKALTDQQGAQVDRQRASLYLWRAGLHGSQGQEEQAQKDAIQGLALLPDHPSQERIMGNVILANLYQHSGQQEARERVWKVAYQDAKAIPDKRRLAILITNKGTYKLEENQYQEAIEWFEEALKYYRELDDPENHARTLQNIAYLYLIWANDTDAYRYLEQALALDPPGEVALVTQLTFAHWHLCQGMYEQALANLDQARHTLHEDNSRWHHEIELMAALLAYRQGDLATALATLAPFLPPYVSPSATLQGLTLSQQGVVLAKLGRQEEAEAAHKAASRYLRSRSYEQAVAQRRWGACRQAQEQQRSAKSRKLLREALETFTMLGAQRDIQRTEALLRSRRWPSS